MDWREITVEFNGRPVSGSYAVENQIVVVRTPHGVKSGQAGTTNPVWIAFRLLAAQRDEIAAGLISVLRFTK